jgi:hypothetical protein
MKIDSVLSLERLGATKSAESVGFFKLNLCLGCGVIDLKTVTATLHFKATGTNK